MGMGDVLKCRVEHAISGFRSSLTRKFCLIKGEHLSAYLVTPFPHILRISFASFSASPIHLLWMLLLGVSIANSIL